MNNVDILRSVIDETNAGDISWIKSCPADNKVSYMSCSYIFEGTEISTDSGTSYDFILTGGLLGCRNFKFYFLSGCHDDNDRNLRDLFLRLVLCIDHSIAVKNAPSSEYQKNDDLSVVNDLLVKSKAKVLLWRKYVRDHTFIYFTTRYRGMTYTLQRTIISSGDFSRKTFILTGGNTNITVVGNSSSNNMSDKDCIIFFALIDLVKVLMHEEPVIVDKVEEAYNYLTKEAFDLIIKFLVP